MDSIAANVTADGRIAELLDFWFDGDPTEHNRPLMKKWFSGTGDEDRALERRFGPLARSAADGELDNWRLAPRGRLALIILLDQLPRSLYRGSPGAFATDPRALELCLEGLDEGQDAALHPLERMFFLMPLQHAESAEAQDRSVAEFESLAATGAAPEVSSALRSSADYAVEHRDIIKRFGRFPHRNASLGRPSTSAELEFLAAGGPRFGQ